MVKQQIEERCQKGYKTHEKRKTKKMFGRTYRNCVKAEAMTEEPESEEEYEVLIGKKMGNKILSRRVHVFATSRDDAKRKAKEENPGFGAMLAAHWESGGLDGGAD